VGPASAFKHHRVASEVIAVHVQPCGLFWVELVFYLRTGQPRSRRPRSGEFTDRIPLVDYAPVSQLDYAYNPCLDRFSLDSSLGVGVIVEGGSLV